jgi:aryl-alcohol dehydrogenase-like predicted oxidoreductase
MTRNLEQELIPVCAELGVGIVAYSPLSRNLLAAPEEKPADWRATCPRFSDENWFRFCFLSLQQ